MDNASHRRAFIAQMIHKLGNAHGQWVWLKAVHEHPCDVPACSDIDLLVRPTLVPWLIDWASEHPLVKDCHVSRRSHVTHVALYFLDGGFLQLDLLTALVRKHLTYLDAEYVFATSVEEGGVVRCAPRVLLEHVLLFNYLNGSGLPWKYVRHFSTYNDRRQFELFTFINDKYGTDFCSIQSMTVFKPHRRQAFEASVARLPANRLVLRARRFLHWLRDSGRELFCERGLTITFSGVDGAGKSTILHSVKELLAHKYRRKVVVLRHRPGLLPILSAWRYGKAKAEQRAASRLPRQGDNGSVFASLLRFLYYFMDYFIGQWYVWLRYTARGYVVLYDRYYFDFIADERRSNLNLGPLGFLPRWLYRLVFEPELNFFLYADAAIIYHRKKELPPQAIEALSRRYRSLFDELGRRDKGRYVSIENLHIDQTLKTIFEHYVDVVTNSATTKQQTNTTCDDQVITHPAAA